MLCTHLRKVLANIIIIIVIIMCNKILLCYWASLNIIVISIITKLNIHQNLNVQKHNNNFLFVQHCSSYMDSRRNRNCNCDYYNTRMTSSALEFVLFFICWFLGGFALRQTVRCISVTVTELQQ